MRIGLDLLSESGRPGGIHTYTNELLRQLLRQDPSSSLEVVAFTWSDYRFFSGIEGSDRLRIVRLPGRSLPAPLRRSGQHALIGKLARRHRADLVHSINNVLPPNLSVPGVLTVLDLSPFTMPSRFARMKQRYLTHWVPDSVRRAHRVLAISEATRANILLWIGDADSRKIDVTPLAAAPEFCPQAPQGEATRLRREHDLPEKFLFHLSRAEPGKNLVATLRALATSQQRGRTMHLVLAGPETPHAAELRQLWSRLGLAAQVTHLGSVPWSDLPGLYRLARGFVFPSQHEGFGLPVLEAMSCGTPTLTSTRSSLPEVAGRSALLVEPSDIEGLADALDRIWSDDLTCRLLTGRGLERARLFSWERCARETLACYRRVLESTRDATQTAMEMGI